jgi:hypothetical protein
MDIDFVRVGAGILAVIVMSFIVYRRQSKASA